MSRNRPYVKWSLIDAQILRLKPGELKAYAESIGLARSTIQARRKLLLNRNLLMALQRRYKQGEDNGSHRLTEDSES